MEEGTLTGMDEIDFDFRSFAEMIRLAITVWVELSKRVKPGKEPKKPRRKRQGSNYK